MEAVVPNCALSATDRDRLARLLAVVPPTRRWAVEHRHSPLLCALGILDAPDVGYANAARRRFTDLSNTKERALALIDELDREARRSATTSGSEPGHGSGRACVLPTHPASRRPRRRSLKTGAAPPPGRQEKRCAGRARSREVQRQSDEVTARHGRAATAWRPTLGWGGTPPCQARAPVEILHA